MSPKLLFAAMRAYPKLSHYLFNMMRRWPLNDNDRDIFMDEFDGATVLMLADPDDPISIASACKFAIKLSSGSESRVTCIERAQFSAKAADALRRYPEDEDVALSALGYLSNVANCPEHWPTLQQFGLDEVCDNVLQKLQEHATAHRLVQNIRHAVH